MNQIIQHTESSMIDSSNYNPETNELIVTFKGGSSYSFNGVVTEDYQAFSESESAGKAFNQYIRKYNGLKVEEPLDENIQQING
jgi:hypothetical protein